MKKTDLTNNDFNNNLYLSVFVGVCNSEELLGEYLEQHWERSEIGLNSSCFGSDFNIKCYNDEYLVSVVNAQMSYNIDEIFVEAKVFDLNLLKQDYSNYLDKQYNAVIIIGRLKYEGKVQEIHNNRFGYFKFLGTYPEPLLDKINDTSDMDKYAVNKLIDWGYSITVSNENRAGYNDDFYLKNHFNWKAKKDGKTFSAIDPLRLLGIVTIVKEYGDAWNRIDVPGIFSITFGNEDGG